MPVVRELVNRISFKINPGDVKNAENAFKGIEDRGGKTIGFFGKLGSGIKKAGKALLAFTLVATKMFVDFERNTGAANFFANSKEDAEALLVIVDDIARKSETTSRREARRAAESLAQLNIRRKTLESFIPFIEKISIAQPKLDFGDVAKSLNQVIKGGDLQELINLVPGIKQQLELLSKTSFGKPFGEILEANRAKLVLQALQKNEGRINELVKKQQETTANAFSRLGKDTSDFTLRFGQTTAPAINEALGALESLIETLNESKGLWDAIDATVRGITGLIKASTEFIKDPSLPDLDPSRNVTGRTQTGSSRPLGIPNMSNRAIGAGNRVPFISQRKDHPVFTPKVGIPNTSSRAVGGIGKDISIKLDVNLKGDTVSSLGSSEMELIINRAFGEKVLNPLKEIIAENGGQPGIGA